VRDLWKHQDLAPATGSFTAKAVPKGDVVMIRLSGGVTKISDGIARASIPVLAIYQKNETIFVDVAQPGVTVVSILDSKGASVRSFRCSGAQLRIDARDMHAGVYFAEVQTAHSAYAQKFVKK
jgi:hypothetical protein